jgi:hypothetical protein
MSGLVAHDLPGFLEGFKPERHEIRMAKYIEGLERYRAGSLSHEEAAEVPRNSERHSRRLRDRYEAAGYRLKRDSPDQMNWNREFDPPACSWTREAKAASISFSVPAFWM